EFERKINTELNDVLGNFIHRTISFTHSHFNGKVPKYDTTKTQHQSIMSSLTSTPRSLETWFEIFRLKDALEKVVELAREGNRYLNEYEPWRLYKTEPDSAGEILGVSIQVV